MREWRHHNLDWTGRVLILAENLKTAWALFNKSTASINFVFKFFVLSMKYPQISDSGFCWRLETNQLDKVFMYGHLRTQVGIGWSR